MMIDPTASINEFLTAAGAKQATPGGGAVAAMAGALAASMGEMVLNYSVAKKDLLAFTEQNTQALKELSDAREMLLKLMVDDQTWYRKYTEAKKLTDEKKTAEALTNCVHTPLLIGQTAMEILRIANRVASTSNKWLLSDLAVCGELATATVRCAVHNVRVNLSEVSQFMRTKHETDCAHMLKDAVKLVNTLMSSIDTAKAT